MLGVPLTLFKIGKSYSGEIATLIAELESEHAELRALYGKLSLGDNAPLVHFGEVLGVHTRKEERQLFEWAQQQFSQAELTEIYTESLK